MFEALRLLEQAAPPADELPAFVERLNLAAFDITTHIQDTADACALIEEQATAEAASESNADKRKVRRGEILRDDGEYARLKAEVRAAERVRVQLQERAHRHAREFRLIVSRNYAQAF